MNLAERMKIIPLLTSANIGASTDLDSINAANAHKITFIFTCGSCTGDVTFSFNSGATNGAKTNAIPFKYGLGGAAIGTAVAGSTASCDVLGATGSATTTQAITCSTKMVVCELDMGNVTQGDTWVTGTVAATAGIVHAVAIVEPRATNYRSGTMLA
jgi:hypothetical protein